jgi:hypothetical protein
LLQIDRWLFSEERKWASPHLITPRIKVPQKSTSVGEGFFKISRCSYFPISFFALAMIASGFFILIVS